MRIIDQLRQIKCVHADDWGLASRPWGDIGRRGLSLPGHHSLEAGRLIGGLGSLARRESWRDGRSALSRHPRECTAARRESASGEIARGIVMQVFLATPTRSEREFCPIDLLRPSRRVPGDVLVRQRESTVQKRSVRFRTPSAANEFRSFPWFRSSAGAIWVSRPGHGRRFPDRRRMRGPGLSLATERSARALRFGLESDRRPTLPSLDPCPFGHLLSDRHPGMWLHVPRFCLTI